MENTYNKQYFNSLSEKNSKIFQMYIRFLSEAGIKFENLNVCDIGCGTGTFLSLILNRNSCYGYDISDFAINTCKETFQDNKDKFHVLNLNSEFLPIDQKFDLITLFDVIEHLDNYTFLKRIISTNLKPGGKLVITTPNANSLLRFLRGSSNYTGEYDQSHTMLFTPYTIDFFLRKSGLKKSSLSTPFSFYFKNDLITKSILLGGQIFCIYSI